jgi:hypothetical protein
MKDMKSMKLKLLYVFGPFMFFMPFMVKIRLFTISSSKTRETKRSGRIRTCLSTVLPDRHP